MKSHNVFGQINYSKRIPDDQMLKRPNPDNKVHGANMGPTSVLSAPDKPHVGPMNLAIWEIHHSPRPGLSPILVSFAHNHVIRQTSEIDW